MDARGRLDFERGSGYAAIAVGIGGLVYSITFVIFLSSGSRSAAEISSLLLMVGGLAALPVMLGVYGRLRGAEPGFAELAVLLGVLGAFGAAAHGAYDLANFIKAPGVAPDGLPNPVDPRGLGTFALTGLALLLVAWVIARGGRLPRRFGTLSLVAGALLVYVYLGRLIILNPKNPAVLVAAVLSGFVVNPVLFVWLGLILLGMEPTLDLRRREPEAPQAPPPQQSPFPQQAPPPPPRPAPPGSEPTQPLP